MAIHVVIPVKELRFAKSRLSNMLKPKMRVELILKLLEHIIKTCIDAGIEKIYVLGVDREVEELSKRFGCTFYRDRWKGLNRSLDGALSSLFKDPDAYIMILPCDLPLISKDDIDVVGKMLKHNDVVLSPSLKFNGTNLMAMKGKVMKLQYGRSSFKKHLEYALLNGLRVAVYFSLSTALDIDRPTDILKLKEIASRGYPIPDVLKSLSYLRL